MKMKMEMNVGREAFDDIPAPAFRYHAIVTTACNCDTHVGFELRLFNWFQKGTGV